MSENFVSHTLKNGQELIIKKAQLSDAIKIVEYINDIGGESDNLSFGKNEGFSYEQTLNYLKNLTSSEISTYNIGLIDGQIVSICDLHASPRKRLRHVAGTAITVRKEFWNLGIATIMIREIIKFAKDTNVIEIVSLQVRMDNAAAIYLYKKLGFETTGINKKHMKIDGVYYDLVCMDLHLKK